MVAADMFVLILTLLVFPCASLEGKSPPTKTSQITLLNRHVCWRELKVCAVRNRQDLVRVGSLANFGAAQKCRSTGYVINPAHRYLQYRVKKGVYLVSPLSAAVGRHIFVQILLILVPPGLT